MAFLELEKARRFTWARRVLAGVSFLSLAWPSLAPAEEATDGDARALVVPGTTRAPQPFSSFEWGSTGETIFEHTRAGLRDPHFGMRLYRDNAVPGTLHEIGNPTAPGSDARAGAPDGPHRFWDVSFGERMPVFTWYDVDPQRARYARGLQVNIDAAAFMLLDFDSQSLGVIDTDFRIGGSLDFRPWWDGWERLSLSVGFFHESTHLGDEYVLSAATIQGDAAPVANALLPYRANPSFEAVPVTVSFDYPFAANHLSVRAYGGASAVFASALPNEAYPSEWRAGGELRWTSQDSGNVMASPGPDAGVVDNIAATLKRRSTGVRRDQAVAVRADRARERRGAFGLEAAYELLGKRQYAHTGPNPRAATFSAGSGYWYVQHAMLMLLYNLDTERSSSNALGLSVDWIRGRSPFGQLTEYTRVEAIAVGLQYYW
jgi:hypothetical protein